MALHNFIRDNSINDANFQSHIQEDGTLMDLNLAQVKEVVLEMTCVGVSSKHQLVNLYLLRIGPRWCAKRHKVYTSSGRMSLRPVCGYCSCY